MKRLALSLIPLLFHAAAAFAAGPPASLSPGMGKYIMVLWPPGTPVPGEGPVVTMKNVPEPDIEQRGGKVLMKFENKRLIQLPLAAATELRRHEAVAFLQRVWTGESFEGWDERYVPPPARGHLHVAPQDDTNLSWGPKSYSYDGSGNIKAIGSDSFAYDSAGRLIQAGVSGKTESYKYDAFGNLTERAVSGSNAVTIPVDPGSNRVQGASYDAGGNATTSKDARWAYGYDAMNMMTRVRATPTGSDRRMIYDANDERIGTILINDNPVSWTFRDLDGRVLREYTSIKSGLDFAMWIWERDYYYGENSLIGGETLDYGFGTENRYGGHRHYHLDHLGNVRMVTTDATGGTRARSVAENDYYPFGTTITRTFQEQINEGDKQVDAMRFAGHWRDFLGLINVDNTEYLDYMHARYYDPNAGRFSSVDTLPANGFQPQTWNRYAYVANSPITFFDPNGLGKVHFVAKVIELLTGGGWRVVGRITDREAAKIAQRAGEDLLMSNRKAAAELATEIGEGHPPVHELHKGEGQYPHYHPADHGGGHIFYSAAAALTFEHWAPDEFPSPHPHYLKWNAELADMISPLSLGQDMLNLWDIFVEGKNTLYSSVKVTARDWEATPWVYTIPMSTFWYNLARKNHDNGHFVSTYDLFNSGQMCIEGVCR